MRPFSLLYERFLRHLKICGGCTGQPKIERCGYARVCATAEALGKKGVVADSEELMRYGINRSKCGDLSEGSDCASEGRYAGIGPCESE